MMCEVCRQKTANVIFKTIADGQVATRAMCMDCAQNLQQDMYRVFMALGLGPGGMNAPQQSRQAEETMKPQPEMPRYLCAHCGRPFDTLDEHTMAGCAHCYGAMQKGLGEMLEGNKAASAIPQQENTETTSDERTELKYQLLEAVMKEDYETAAALRDKIRAMASAVHAEEEP